MVGLWVSGVLFLATLMPGGGVLAPGSSGGRGLAAQAARISRKASSRRDIGIMLWFVRLFFNAYFLG